MQFALRDPLTGLRPAEAADQPLIRHLFKTIRAEGFAGAGLPQASLDMVLEQQYRAQAAGYAAQFPNAVTLIILRCDEPAGRLILAAGDRRWRIVDIVLLPAARGRGAGTDILDAIARAARDSGVRELTLSVLSTNVGARRLYARLGFSERMASRISKCQSIWIGERKAPSTSAVLTSSGGSCCAQWPARSMISLPFGAISALGRSLR